MSPILFSPISGIKKLVMIENHCYGTCEIIFQVVCSLLERDKQTKSIQVNNFPAKVLL